MVSVAKGATLPGLGLPRSLRYRSRLLFHWRAADLLLGHDPTEAVLKALTGEAPTFSRASAGGYTIDREGRLRQWAQGQPRLEMVDLDGDGVRETPGAVLESERTNLVTWSDALSNWTSVGTPTVTDAAVSVGGLDLALLGDDDAVSLENKVLTVTYTGDGVKSLLVAVKKGTSSPAGGSSIVVRDTTAGANRLTIVVTWSGEVPSFAVATGTQLGSAELLSDGVYLARFQTTAVTAANTHDIRLHPADLAAETGNIYIGGVQMENATYPSSRIKTTGSTVIRSPERLEYPFAVLPRAMTVYAHFIERAQPNWVDVGGLGPRIVQIGASNDADPALIIRKVGTADSYQAYQSSVTSTLDLNPVFGDRNELRLVLNDDGSVQLHGAKNGGAESSATASAANALAAAWSAPTLVSVGCIGASGQGDITLFELKIAPGVQSMPQMRELL